jgi:hypothetical protein
MDDENVLASVCVSSRSPIGALAVPTRALAAGAVDPNIFMGSSRLAEVNFDIPDPNNPCLDTSGFIFGTNAVNSSPGTPATTFSVGGAFIATSDNCAGTMISGVFYKGLLSPGAFQLDTSLTSASLQTTATGFDQNGNPVSLAIDVTWTGSGALTSGKTSSHFRAPGITIVGHSSGESRPATASGTVTVAGSTVTVAGAGDLQSNSSFNLFICRSPSTGCK